MEFKVKNKIIEIKFDYRTMFKVDKQLATKNKETGASNNDGVGTLFNNILNRNDEGIVDLILLSANKAFTKVSFKCPGAGWTTKPFCLFTTKISSSS